MVGAIVAMRPISGVTMAWRDGGKIVKAAANTVGIMPPPMKPCTARQTIMVPIDVLSPHIKLAKVNPPHEIANSVRVPSARDRKPESGIATTSAMRYAVWTQGISSPDAARPAWISLSEAETIWMSRMAMNMPKHMAMKATTRRGSMRSCLIATADVSMAASLASISSQPVSKARGRRRGPRRAWCRRLRRPTFRAVARRARRCRRAHGCAPAGAG